MSIFQHCKHSTFNRFPHSADQNFIAESLIPDAPELIENFLAGESDTTCKRNAFVALMAISHQKALTYLSNTFDSIPNVDELLQLVEIEFIRRDAVENSANSELQFFP
jgi:coatomer subunit beta